MFGAPSGERSHSPPVKSRVLGQLSFGGDWRGRRDSNPRTQLATKDPCRWTTASIGRSDRIRTCVRPAPKTGGQPLAHAPNERCSSSADCWRVRLPGRSPRGLGKLVRMAGFEPARPSTSGWGLFPLGYMRQVAVPPGLEPGLSGLRGRRLVQFAYGTGAPGAGRGLPVKTEVHARSQMGTVMPGIGGSAGNSTRSSCVQNRRATR